jgi:hypothetical protein
VGSRTAAEDVEVLMPASRQDILSGTVIAPLMIFCL